MGSKLITLLRRKSLWQQIESAEDQQFVERLTDEQDSEIIGLLGQGNFTLNDVVRAATMVLAEKSSPEPERSAGWVGMIEEIIESESDQPQSSQIDSDTVTPPLDPAPIQNVEETVVERVEPEVTQQDAESGIPSQVVELREEPQEATVETSQVRKKEKREPKPDKSGTPLLKREVKFPAFIGNIWGKVGGLIKRTPKQTQERAERPQRPARNTGGGGGRRSLMPSMPKFGANPVLAKIGVAIFILLVGGGIAYAASNPEMLPPFLRQGRDLDPNWFNVPPPTIVPLDFFHITQPSINQVIILICTFLVGVCVFMDAMQRREKSDFRLTVGAIAVILVSGAVFHLTKNSFWIGVMQFNPNQMKVIQILYGGLFTATAFIMVFLASIQGRRDWSPMGGLITVMAASGILLGTKGLGSLGIVLLLEDNAVVPVPTIWSMFWYKMFNQMGTSLLIYVLITLGTLVLGREAYRSIRASKPGAERILTSLGSTLLLIGYLVGRFIFPQIHPIFVFLSALGLSAVLGLQPQQESHEAEDKNYTGSSVSLGEVREGRALIPPYDKLAWQVAAILLTVVLSGTV